MISGIFHHRLILNVLMITSLIQIGLFSIQPLLSLYVSQLTDSKEVAFLAGITFSATGVGSLIISLELGGNSVIRLDMKKYYPFY